MAVVQGVPGHQILLILKILGRIFNLENSDFLD